MICDKKNTCKQILQTSLILFILLQISLSSAWAAPTVADKEEQNRRVRQEALDKKERQGRSDVFLQPPSEAKPEVGLPEESLSFPIQTIILQGEHLEQFAWLQEALRKYQNRNIGLQGINLIVKQATNLLIERGYVTSRLLIPAQDLSTGTLTLVLVPGIIHDIRFQDPEQKGNWHTAFPVRPGDILNLRDLEQGLEQLKRVPSQDAEMQLVPAETPGQSDVVINLKQTKPWKVILSIDDSGSKATGELQLAQTFIYDNLLQANDLFHFSFNQDGEQSGSQYGTKGHSIYYSRPDGNFTYTISQNSYDYHQTVLAGSQPISYSGTNRDTRFTVEKLIQRDQTSKTHLELGLVKRSSQNFVEDTEILVQRKNTTALTLALHERRYLGQTTLDTRIAHQQGVPWFGAQADLTGSNLPTTRYHIWTIDAAIVKPAAVAGIKSQYRMSISGQYSNNRLYAADSFSIGNRYTVRGFDGEQTLSAENGWYLQNELMVPAGVASIYWGLDYGQVSGPPAAGLSSKALAGTVVGVRGGSGGGSYDLFIGWPLKKPAGFTSATPTYGFQWIQQI
ncbi:ShlB/FhaC/HecB family hemolysin secretion/activation protein [Sporomusa termitida]|uniref:Hemolysin transporter protein ShlB n=1 Tax=Sporomusa termitida TaxID=2377 RepID=A0A517DRD0_9FIRM|nr:ShlB/FhaC/HecB family hemolysin secretion/activation protein [Sporomusa termitida]QDR79924.1 Hemolysin transporter protein ShlB [Sporomusa termitida]